MRTTLRVRSGTAGWSASSVVAALLVVVPVAMLAGSVLRPNSEVWAQQWRTRLPGELVTTAILLAGVAVGTIVLGAGLAWLVSAYRFPGVTTFGWMLVLPFAMPSYILGFLTVSTFGRDRPDPGHVEVVVRTGRVVPEGRVARRRDRGVHAGAVPVRLPARQGGAP